MTNAPSLHELQAAFDRSVFAGDAQGLEPWVDARGLAPQDRIQVYRNMVFNTLSGALVTSFPVVLRLVGQDCFEGLASRYIAAIPSSSGNLQDYGQSFPDFLASAAETAGLPYLPDVARLEWLRQEAYLAADADAIAPEWLTLLKDDELAQSKIDLHPSIHLLASQHPIFDIWRFCHDENPHQLHLGGEGQAVMVWRDDIQIAIQPVSLGAHRFVAALLAGRSLDEAISAAVAIDPEFDLASAFHLLLQHGLVVDAHIDPRR